MSGAASIDLALSEHQGLSGSSICLLHVPVDGYGIKIQFQGTCPRSCERGWSAPRLYIYVILADIMKRELETDSVRQPKQGGH